MFHYTVHWLADNRLFHSMFHFLEGGGGKEKLAVTARVDLDKIKWLSSAPGCDLVRFFCGHYAELRFVWRIMYQVLLCLPDNCAGDERYFVN